MANRVKFIAGNWKMFTTAQAAGELARAVYSGLDRKSQVEVAVCPPFPYLRVVAEALRGSNVGLGAQNLYPQTEGAFTGEVSPAMLLDCGCRWVIVGHSERRHKLGETDGFINQKVLAGLAAGLNVILCVGETLAEREAGHTEPVLRTQLLAGVAGVATEKVANLVIAYEPVWAIGTGKNATPDQAQESHAFLRGRLSEALGAALAQTVRIQYGGSVKPDNAATLLGQPDVDGALVGGASLQADSFLAIVRAAS
jgi:triosephosphate isomerase